MHFITCLWKKIFSFNPCACYNVSVLVWIPEKADPETETWVEVVYLEGDPRGNGWGSRESKTGKKEKQMEIALLRSQLEATEPLRSVQVSPRIVLLKDGKWGIYPVDPIPTGLELPVGSTNFPSSIHPGAMLYAWLPSLQRNPWDRKQSNAWWDSGARMDSMYRSVYPSCGWDQSRAISHPTYEL